MTTLPKVRGEPEGREGSGRHYRELQLAGWFAFGIAMAFSRGQATPVKEVS